MRVERCVATGHTPGTWRWGPLVIVLTRVLNDDDHCRSSGGLTETSLAPMLVKLYRRVPQRAAGDLSAVARADTGRAVRRCSCLSLLDVGLNDPCGHSGLLSDMVPG